MSSERHINIHMGQELTLKEVNARYPSVTGVRIFKSWFNALMKAASVNEASFFGDDVPRIIPTGKLYTITMDGTNMEKVRKTLNSSNRPEFKESKYAIVYENKSGQPIKLEFGIPGDKVILAFKLEKTGKAPRGTGKTSQKPSTIEQEKVTLKIFEELLSVATPKWDRLGYRALRDQELKKIYGDIDHPEREDWDKHFELTFNEVRDVTKLPNSNFDVYSYTDFMKFIEDWVVKKGPKGSGSAWPVAGKISKKDSWNPADIWLVKKGNAYKDYMTRIQEAPKLEVVNGILREAYEAMIIVGISLKKSSGKKLYYDLLNLETNLPDYPEIEFEKMKIDLPFDSRSKKFTKTTNNITIKEKGGTTVGEMRIGTNTTGKGNNTYEFKAAGAQAAQLGKIPKDLMLERLKQVRGMSDIKELPTWQEVENHLPEMFSDKTNMNYWQKRVDGIKGKPAYFTIQGQTLNDFVANLASYNGRTPIQKTEAAAGQIVEFAYLLSQMSKSALDSFMQDCFYFAQKKGMSLTYRFGPFGKLH